MRRNWGQSLFPTQVLRDTFQGMSVNVKKHVVNAVKASPLLYFEMDEWTDASPCSQLLACVKCIRSGHFKEEFLPCSYMDTKTTSADVLKKINTCFESENSQWSDVHDLYWRRSCYAWVTFGLSKTVRELTPEAMCKNSFIHRYMHSLEKHKT